MYAKRKCELEDHKDIEVGKQCQKCKGWIIDISAEEMRALKKEMSESSLPPGFRK